MLIFTIFPFLLTTLLPIPPKEPDPYSLCNTNITCGTIQNIPYPFWDGTQSQNCGYPDFKLDCHENNNPTIEIETMKYRVISVNPVLKTMKLARTDLTENLCPTRLINTTMDRSPFSFTSNLNISLFCNCSTIAFHEIYKSSCLIFPGECYFSVGLLFECQTRIFIPLFPIRDLNLSAGILPEIFKSGFEVRWASSGYPCRDCFGSDHSMGPVHSPEIGGEIGNKTWNWKRKIITGACGAFFGMCLMCVVIVIYYRRKKHQYTDPSLLSRDPTSPSSVTDSVKRGNYKGVQIFTYDELEEATNNFDSAKELGDGGFGTVYYGDLRDGRRVAVKRLYENNFRRVELFMNEVEILIRLRHHNLVSLYGCTSRHSRELLLVYEYIPNGTVADHLHGSHSKTGSLTLPIRISIAMETASALSYLHASDIIHRDVKTNNILLDNNYTVKVADFGLSRLFPINVTHVSTAPQGTPGYVDPEYHQCYQLTDKSDVYSFGVVLIELISSMPAVDITRHRHEINLSNMALAKIQNYALHEIVDGTLGFNTDEKATRVICGVAELAFRCLQGEKEMRPTMDEVMKDLLHVQNDM